ncbi:hypothetical protein TIFTF001_032769 [Ficus carica]|uniref:Uncharacterized protein n=1 Tax=Ficus carica TaxID=3494 RepID=A0AA88DXT7_FICCA|nr:hypothetical protein TIFTF001_032769 [Ficus carica]
MISFDIPADFPTNGVNLDKLSWPGDKRTLISQNPREYSFNQRLKGWKVKRKQRDDGRYDKRSEERKRPRSWKKAKKPPPVNPNLQNSGNRPEETSTLGTIPTASTNVSVDDPVKNYWQVHKEYGENSLAVAHNNFVNDTQDEIAVEFEERLRMAKDKLQTKKRRRTENSNEREIRRTKIPKRTRSEGIVIPMEADHDGRGQEMRSEPNLNSAKTEKMTASSSKIPKQTRSEGIVM